MECHETVSPHKSACYVDVTHSIARSHAKVLVESGWTVAVLVKPGASLIARSSTPCSSTGIVRKCDGTNLEQSVWISLFVSSR